VKMENKPF